MTDSLDGIGGKKLGRYLLRYLIAEGGMASVYLAQLPGPHGFEKWTAAKVIHPHLAKNRRFVAMFLDEARIAARIHHPNVCSVTDFGEEEAEGVPYLIMEYLHGETFASILRRSRKDRPPPPRWLCARVVADAARGLHAAHELRSDDEQPLEIVHRDMSPQNIVVLYDGISKVLDFGVARLRGRVGDTKSGEIKGKLRYMAPEQLRRSPIDRRTDVWALGVVLWESTVGRRLFAAENEGAVVLEVLEGEIPRPSSIVDGYPPALEKAVMRSLQREPDDRYPTAAAFADDLESFLYGLGQPAGPAQVAAWLKQNFGDRLSSREALLRAPALPSAVVPEVDLGSLSPADAEAISPVVERPAVASQKPFPYRKLLPVAAGFFAVALVVGIVLAVLRPGSASEGDNRPRLGDAAVAMLPDSAAAAAPDAGRPRPNGEQPGATRDGGGSGMDFSNTPPAIPDAAASRGDGGRPPRVDPGSGSGGDDRVERGPPGRLNLMAIPAAEVFLKGRSLGRTPLFNRSLPPGRHRLTLRPVGGGRSKTIVVRIRSGQTERRSVRLAN